MNLLTLKPYFKVIADAQSRALDGTCYVVRGLAPTANGTGLRVDVAAGDSIDNGAPHFAYGGGNVTCSAAPSAASLQYRYDIVYRASNGTLALGTGTADLKTSTTPVPPALPDGATLIAVVFIAPGQTTLVATDVEDCRQTRSHAFFDVKAFGATGDGVTDDQAAIQNAYTQAAVQGGVVLYPPGTYRVTVSPVLTTSKRVLVIGYGAELSPVGAIFGHTVRDSGNTIWQVTIAGLTVNCQPAATAAVIGGFLTENSWQTCYRDCNFVGDAVAGSGTFVGAYVTRNKTAATASTGSLWTRFDNCRIRNQSGSSKITAGYVFSEDANASMISGGLITACTDGVLVNSRNATLQLNHLTIVGCDMDICTNGVVIDGQGPGGEGVRVISCRADNMTNFFLVRNRTVAFSTTNFVVGGPPVLIGNTLLSGVTNYIGTLASGIVVSMDEGQVRSHAPKGTFALNSTTPSAANLSWVQTNATAATTITNITGGREGQLLIIHAQDANTTLSHAAGGVGDILMANGANQLLTGGAAYLFVYDATATRWRQIRTTN